MSFVVVGYPWVRYVNKEWGWEWLYMSVLSVSAFHEVLFGLIKLICLWLEAGEKKHFPLLALRGGR